MSTRTRTHPVNVGHLVMGVALLGLAGVWAILTLGLVSADQVRFWLPAPWLLAGAVGLLATVVSRARRPVGVPPDDRTHEQAHDRAADGWYERYEAERRADLAARIDAAARARTQTPDPPASTHSPESTQTPETPETPVAPEKGS